MRYCKFVVLMICCFFLCGCQSMPEEVAENMESYNKDKDIAEEEITVNYVDCTDLEEDVNNALTDEYQNFDYPSQDSVSCTYPDFIEIPLFRMEDDFSVNRDKIMCDFWGADIWEKEKSLYSDDTLYDEINKYYATVQNRGFVCAIKPAAFDDMLENPGEHIAEIRPQFDSIPTENYTFCDGMYSVLQANNYVTQWFETVWSKYQPEFTFKISKIDVYRKQNGDYYFAFEITQLYHDIPLDNMGYMPFVENEQGNLVCKYTMAKIYIKMYTCGSIDLFTNSPGIIVPDSEKNVLTQCVSLHTGLKQIEKEFSGFKNLEVEDVELKYMLQPIYSPENDENVYTSGIEIIAKPVWCIKLKGNKMSILPEDMNIQKFINIDIQTGELEYQIE